MTKPYSTDLRVRVVEAVAREPRDERRRSASVSASVLRFAGISGGMRGQSRPSPTAEAAHLWRITPRRFSPSSRNSRT